MNNGSIIKEYTIGTLSYNEELNAIIYTAKQDIFVETPDIIEMLNDIKVFMGNKKHFGIIDLGSNVMSSAEVKRAYATCEYIKTHRIADAIIVNSLAMRLTANFFIKATKPQIPTAFFNSKQEAIKWFQKIDSKQIE